MSQKRNGCVNRKLVKIRKLKIEMQGGKCFYCTKPFIENSIQWRATAEHIVPWSEGGKETLENIVAAHEVCNRRRDKQDFFKYLKEVHPICKEITREINSAMVQLQLLHWEKGII